MTALPLSTTFTDNSVTEAGLKQSITNLRDYLSGLLGTTGVVADARTVLGAQTTNAKLDSFVALTGAPNKLPYFTGTTSMAVADITAQGLELLNDTSYSAMLTTLGAAPVASPTFTGVPAAPTAAAGTNTTQIATTAFVTANQNPAGRNRVVNGSCRIDQKNVHTTFQSGTTTDGFLAENWYYTRSASLSASTYQMKTSGGPSNNPYYLDYLASTGAVSTSYIYCLTSKIEGIFLDDLALWTANTKPFTISFKAKSSITGTHAVSLHNASRNYSYVHLFTISSTNTWETFSFSPTSPNFGSYSLVEGVAGLVIDFDLGAPSSNETTLQDQWIAGDYRRISTCPRVADTSTATFSITDLQLESGTVATSYEYLSFIENLYKCKRYYEKSYPYSIEYGTITTNTYNRSVLGTTGTVNATSAIYEVEKAVSPTSYGVNSTNSGSGGYVYRVDISPADVLVNTVSTNKKSIFLSINASSQLHVSYHWWVEATL